MSIDLKNILVLVVEDSATQALLLKNSLEENGLSVTLAKDGNEALKKMCEKKPDIVITDIEMPGMDGFTFCKTIKTNSKLNDVPVILLTGLSDPMDVIRGIECQSDSFLTKPCNIDFILATVSDVLQNAKQPKTESRMTEFYFEGRRHQLPVNNERITSLLLSTYSNAIQKNLELQSAYQELNITNAQLSEKNADLKVLNNIKNQFLGMAAHDLRNPLNVILGYSEMLLSEIKDKISANSLRMIDRIKNSSRLMLDLVNDLLDFSAIESGVVSLKLSDVDFLSLMQENLTMLNNLAEKKNIKIEFAPKNSFPQVTCDANKITQIINNLITNAIKFSKSGDTIEVSLKPSKTEITFIVKDSGKGISKEAKERLFQPFSSVSSTGTAGEKGTGLGLAIVNKIIKEHKGKIWVESEEGKGSTFFVSLPFKHD